MTLSFLHELGHDPAMNALLLALSFQIQFIGPCTHEPLLSVEFNSPATTVGALTVMTLDQEGVVFEGSEEGLVSAFGTPKGMAALEIISEQEMRSFGWCFAVDEQVPEIFPHEFHLTKNKKVTWFYGYAHYLNGEWVAQCRPAYEVRPAFLCGR